MSTTTCRICTVNSNGLRYIVQALELRHDDPAKNWACTWGEVSSYRGLSARMGDSKRFRMDKVTITEVPRTEELLSSLLAQHVEQRRSQGEVITRTRGGNYKNHGTPLARARVLDARYRLGQDGGFPSMERAIVEIGALMGNRAPRPQPSKAATECGLYTLATEAIDAGHDDQAETILAMIDQLVA